MFLFCFLEKPERQRRGWYAKKDKNQNSEPSELKQMKLLFDKCIKLENYRKKIQDALLNDYRSPTKTYEEVKEDIVLKFSNIVQYCVNSLSNIYEIVFISLIMMGEMYRILQDIESAIHSFKKAVTQ